MATDDDPQDESPAETNESEEAQPTRGLTRRWRTLGAVAVSLAAFLTWYGTVRGGGRLFVCDIIAFVGLAAPGRRPEYRIKTSCLIELSDRKSA